MEDFKKVFTRMATKYTEYVEEKIVSQSKLRKEEGKEVVSIDSAYKEAITLMNEVRTANVIAVTLTRMNTKENEEHAKYSAN